MPKYAVVTVCHVEKSLLLIWGFLYVTVLTGLSKFTPILILNTPSRSPISKLLDLAIVNDVS